MSTREDAVDVLVVGAGPVGLTVGSELRRHGVGCRVVDRLDDPPQYAKAVGVQPRTLEVWEDMGMVRDVLDTAVEMRGQVVFVNGEQVAQLELSLPPQIPYGFLGLPPSTATPSAGCSCAATLPTSTLRPGRRE
jgi:2-polyprenyl-6-methoxyphenol hydroxylase-like FAD-dependent oxidoreductase